MIFFAAINIRINPETDSVFNVPTVRKIEIPQPRLNKTKEYFNEPTISTNLYKDIIEIVYNVGRNIEKKPSLYKGKDEEALRDQFLLFLETRYEATTASGETFNRGGKTDILLKYARDGSNLFIAECKFWHGSAEFLKAISQLFDRYLTWRDSKVALIMFVKQTGFSSVLATIRKDVSSHPYYKRHMGDREESSFSYEFHLPQDSGRTVQLEIMAFHYDK